MELLFSLFEVITPWHWLGLALVLIGLEMMFGTYDLLWLSGAAFLTAGYAVIAPAGMDGWQTHLIVFAIAGVILVVLGRTAFSGLRQAKSDRPNLNQKGKTLVGRRAIAVSEFVAGEGRVKIGDSTWMAVTSGDVAISEGMEVTISEVKGTLLTVSA